VSENLPPENSFRVSQEHRRRRVGLFEDEKADKGLCHLKNNLTDYCGRADLFKQLLTFQKVMQDIENIQHWKDGTQMAEHIYFLVDNDNS
jgi:hypothetical protein